MLVCALAMFLVSCSTKKFDENLTKAFVSAQICYGTSELIIDNTTSVWSKAIYDNRDSHGDYCSDFNTALYRLFKDYKEKDVFSTISEYQEELKTAVSSMSKAPKSRKEAYDDILQIATEINMLCEMTEEPSGSLQSYRSQTNDLLFNLKKELDAFELKYGDFLVKNLLNEINESSNNQNI